MRLNSNQTQKNEGEPLITDERLEIWKKMEKENQKSLKKGKDPRSFVGIYKNIRDYKKREKWIENEEFEAFYNMQEHLKNKYSSDIEEIEYEKKTKTN
jgi:hypothetical protein